MELVLAVSVAVLLAALLGFSLLTLYPPSDLSYDTTLYHLPLARDLVHHHGLVYDPFVRYSFFPQANESLFAVTMLLSIFEGGFALHPSASAGAARTLAANSAMAALRYIARIPFFSSSGAFCVPGLNGSALGRLLPFMHEPP